MRKWQQADVKCVLFFCFFDFHLISYKSDPFRKDLQIKMTFVVAKMRILKGHYVVLDQKFKLILNFAVNYNEAQAQTRK